MDYVKAFIIGGIICSIGQFILDKTKLTNARILVIFVTLGAVLTGFGVYQKIVDFAGAGATVPLTGFGYKLAIGAIHEVQVKGLLGAFTGGFTAVAAGLAAAIFFGYLIALLASPKAKR